MEKYNFDKKIFMNKFKEKDYDYCITEMRKEIISFITKRIQEKDSSFTYTTTTNLKNKCIEYLSRNEQEVVCELYLINYDEIPQLNKLYNLEEIYIKLRGEMNNGI